LKLSIGDVVDRWTIAWLKHYRGKVDTYEECIAYQTYSENYDSNVIKEAFEGLLAANGNIWLLESDIRQGKEGELGLEEVGRRALKIRDLNAGRIKIKNKLNEHFKEGFVEVKVNHASEAK